MDDIVDDPTYAELGDVITIEDRDLGPVRMQGVIPRLPTIRERCGARDPASVRTTSTCCRTARTHNEASPALGDVRRDLGRPDFGRRRAGGAG